MARKLKEFAFDRDDDKKFLPWDIWLNGEIWEIPLSDTNYATLDNLRTAFYMKAYDRALKVKTKKDEEKQVIVIQAFKEE